MHHDDTLAEAADPLDEELSLRLAQNLRMRSGTFDDGMTQTFAARFALSGSCDGGEHAFAHSGREIGIVPALNDQSQGDADVRGEHMGGGLFVADDESPLLFGFERQTAQNLARLRLRLG